MVCIIPCPREMTAKQIHFLPIRIQPEYRLADVLSIQKIGPPYYTYNTVQDFRAKHKKLCLSFTVICVYFSQHNCHVRPRLAVLPTVPRRPLRCPLSRRVVKSAAVGSPRVVAALRHPEGTRQQGPGCSSQATQVTGAEDPLYGEKKILDPIKTTNLCTVNLSN